MWKLECTHPPFIWKPECTRAPCICRKLESILLFLQLFSFLLMCPVSGGTFGEDYDCLLSFKLKVEDTQNILSSWKTSQHEEAAPPPCNGSISPWNGVICDNNRVFSLTLPNSGLTGAISPNLSRCSALSTLDLSANRLTGEIPTTLGELSNLVSLNLSQNELTGKIPAQLSNCSYLSTLDLHGNALRGPIPTELGNLGRLQELDMSDNSLSGQIPPTLSYNVGGTARFNASSFEGNRELHGFPLPNGRGHALSLIEILGVGLASGVLSLSVSFTVVCLWLKLAEQRRAAEEGRISGLIAEA